MYLVTCHHMFYKCFNFQHHCLYPDKIEYILKIYSLKDIPQVFMSKNKLDSGCILRTCLNFFKYSLFSSQGIPKQIGLPSILSQFLIRLANIRKKSLVPRPFRKPGILSPCTKIRFNEQHAVYLNYKKALDQTI